jgi:tetratricopeptide (TPR) repeat protein
VNKTSLNPEREEVEKGAQAFVGARRGNLQEHSFPKLLARFCREKVNGGLLLSQGKIKKIVYFKNGFPVAAKSNLLRECLGKILVHEKMILEADCAESIQRMHQTGRQQGTVLIEMGSISSHNLNYALDLQLRTKLFDVFGWERGEYQFSSRSRLPSSTVTLGSTIAALIYEGIRQKYTQDRLKKLLDDDLDKYLALHPDPLFRFQDMELDLREESFVARINGKWTLRQILESGLAKNKVYALVYALVCAEMIRITPEATAEIREPVEKPAGHVPEYNGLSTEESRLHEQIAQQIVKLKGQDFFEILKISKNATDAEIEKAYFALAKQHHPDRLYANASTEIRKLAKELFGIISKAHDVLSDDARRAEYLKNRNNSGKPGDQGQVSRILSAEGLFQQGELALSQRDYGKARDLFEQALEMCPEESEFHAFLGWALFQSAPKSSQRQRQAREQLSLAIALNPKLDKSHLFLGYIYKTMEDLETAEYEFEKAIQCNPDCTEALRELRLISMRRENKRGKH